MIQILVKSNIKNAIIEDKNIFIRLLIQKFSSDLCYIITDKQGNVELANLRPKKDKNLYIYYCWTERLLKGSPGRDWVTNNIKHLVIFSRSE